MPRVEALGRELSNGLCMGGTIREQSAIQIAVGQSTLQHHTKVSTVFSAHEARRAEQVDYRLACLQAPHAEPLVLLHRDRVKHNIINLICVWVD